MVETRREDGMTDNKKNNNPGKSGKDGTARGKNLKRIYKGRWKNPFGNYEASLKQCLFPEIRCTQI